MAPRAAMSHPGGICSSLEVIQGALMPTQVVLALLILGCCVAAYWRFPGLREHTRRVPPFLVTAIGVYGLVLALSARQFGGVDLTGRAGSWRALLLLQSIAFMAAGLWLAWRTEGPPRALRNRFGSAPWNLLLAPVLALLIVIL